MKWSDLSFKEKKQIYDSIKAQNPDTTYLDIKSQFDSIPGYEDGKDNSVAAVYSLPEVTVYPQNKFGDIARTQGYETAKNWQTVRNATTAGINEFVNDPRTQMVLAAVPMPSGIEVLSDAINIGKSASKSKQLFYHGSPVRFDKFDAQFIGRANGAVRNQYDLYIDKQRYIDRLNRLVPMEWLLPTIGLGGAEFLREKQNNKSN